MSIKIQDSFNRANSGTLGTADVGGAWGIITNSGYSWQISSNTAKALGTPVTGLVGNYIDHGALILPFSFSFHYIPGGGTRGGVVHAYADLAGNFTPGVGIRFTNNTTVATIFSGASETTATVDWGIDEYIWVDVRANGSNVDVLLYVSTTNTKPGTETGILSNVALATTDTYFTFVYDSNAPTAFWSMDNLLLEDDVKARSPLPTFFRM